MKKIIQIITLQVLVWGFAQDVFAEAGIFQSYGIFSSVNNSGSSLLGQYYDMQAATSFPNFQGNNFGTFDLNNSGNLLQIKGGELTLFKDNGWDVSAASMYYRISDNLLAPSGSFTSVSFNWMQNIGANDQKWGRSDLSTNLLTGLAANKTYRLEVYYDINTNQGAPSDKRYDSNSEGNYIATFSTIPEPSSASLMSLGAAGLLALRRRRNA